tara:strand:- start:25310 stop:26905 length:1596 start_codon:yes stop_codon:yes gene_type:complete
MLPSIRAAFERDDSERGDSLDKARLCAELTKPHILPPEGWNDGETLPQAFSALASRGITNLEGRLLLALFPTGQPFFRLKPATKFKFDPEVDPSLLQSFEDKLRIHEMIMIAKLEKDDSDGGTNARRAGFRSRMRSAISQLLVTGDVLIQMTDEYQIRIHRRDNYVVRRSTSGDVMYMITREQVDSLSLSPEQIEMIGLDLETEMNTPAYDRMQDLYTKCEWNPMSKRWVVEQQIKDVTIVTSEEKVSPYFAIPYSLPPTGHYGRGIIEENLGDVRAINELTERLLDFAALSSKHLFALDYSSQVRPQDLALPTGSVFQARVQGGQVTDVGILRTDRAGDFGVVQNVRESLSRDLSKVMMMEAEQLPTYERASRLHVERVAMELEGALGGVYAPIADALQIPLVERLMHLLERDGVMPSLPADSVEVEAVTGISALSREGDQQKLLQLLQTIAQMGPDMMQRFDRSLLLDILVRHSGVYEPGLVKSEEVMQQETAQQQQQQIMQTAGQQVAQSGGQALVEAAMGQMENPNV